MKKYLIIIAFLISLALPVAAYEPIIQEGKVWEYLEDVDSRYVDEASFLFSRYVFKGWDIKYGKKYYIWTLLDQTTYYVSGDMFRFPPKDYTITKTETTIANKPIALLREEEGRLYIYLDKPEIRKYYPEKRNIFPYEVSAGEEAILYDFNLEQGDWFEMLYHSYCLTDALVTKTDQVSIGSEAVKSYYISTGVENPDSRPDERGELGLQCMESVGLINDGTLISIVSNAHKPIAGISWPLGLFALYDENGEIIFLNSRIFKPSGIQEVGETHLDASTMYDLFGREITRPLPGSVYIRNGKQLIGK